MSAERQRSATFVISDLHIGAGKTDDCDLELERSLIQFLKFLNSRNDKVELVINGDFLDFAQAPPYRDPDLRSKTAEGVPLCFTENQSLKKLESIYEAHHPIFDALRDYLTRNGGNYLVILPGNHDVDFFWPSIRENFIDLIGETLAVSDKLTFHLEPAYYPSGKPTVRIEHGHRYDPCNWFKIDDIEHWGADTPPILKDCSGEERLLECVGTRFLNQFLNRLDEDYPFVDNVKPFSKFLEFFGMSALRPGLGPFKAAVAIWSMLKYLSEVVLHHRTDILKIDNSADSKVNHPFQLFVKEMTDEQRILLTKILQKNGFKIFSPLIMYIEDNKNAEVCNEFLADHLELLDGFKEKDPSLLSLSGSTGTLSLGKRFVVDETKHLASKAQKIIESEALDIVIMGHTHVPIDRTQRINYINTGSWTRYYQCKGGEHLGSWSILKEDSYKNFPYELKYAEVVLGRVASAQLTTFRERNYDTK